MPTYADLLKKRLMDPRDRRSLRQVGRDTGFSYEHIRKIVAGEVTFTKGCSDAICENLGLDRELMWRLAQNQRIREKFKGADVKADLPRDPRVREIWDELTPDLRDAWIDIGRTLCKAVKHAVA
jgi:hypothetical protein